jgi:hypothetical protein
LPGGVGRTGGPNISDLRCSTPRTNERRTPHGPTYWQAR